MLKMLLMFIHAYSSDSDDADAGDYDANGDYDDFDGVTTYKKRWAQSPASSLHHSWAGPYVQQHSWKILKIKRCCWKFLKIKWCS